MKANSDSLQNCFEIYYWSFLPLECLKVGEKCCFYVVVGSLPISVGSKRYDSIRVSPKMANLPSFFHQYWSVMKKTQKSKKRLRDLRWLYCGKYKSWLHNPRKINDWPKGEYIWTTFFTKSSYIFPKLTKIDTTSQHLERMKSWGLYHFYFLLRVRV